MANMDRLTAILVLILSMPMAALAQEPGKDEDGCKPSALISRMPGCGIMRCEVKEFDAASIIQNKTGEEKEFEGQTEKLVFICPVSQSSLQIIRNGEAALRKAGYTIVFSGKVENATEPTVVGRKGSQWVELTGSGWNEFPGYEQTAVLEQAMTEQMTASAQAMADAIAKSGKLDVYGIMFATGQATITPASDAVLGDVLAVLSANPDWKLRVEGHTDNVGDKAANLKLSNARAAAVAAWLTSKGIDAGRLSAAGLGDTQPVAPNATDDGRAKNRRVVLVKM